MRVEPQLQSLAKQLIFLTAERLLARGVTVRDGNWRPFERTCRKFVRQVEVLRAAEGVRKKLYAKRVWRLKVGGAVQEEMRVYPYLSYQDFMVALRR